ncbi:MAG: serine/threonine protein kinase [Candidatus Riflebacteria bacterium]|nr:serine/threonine protein kinase [Candidatus Riflebacteria bacterium]
MGTVHLARQLSLGRLVALKRIRSEEPALDEAMVARFRREGEFLKSLTHPNVVKLLDFDLEEPDPYLVFEYVPDARTLGEAITEGIGSLDDALAIAEGIASGLASIHERQVIHRDLKSGNVLLDRARPPRIIDFGLAFLLGCPDRTRLTADGDILGTLRYMAPEQMTGDDATMRSDVYSFGLILYELAAGRPVFGGLQDGAIQASRRLAGAIPSPATFNPDLPALLVRLVERCVARRPEDRPASGIEVLAQIGRIVEERSSRRTLAPAEVQEDAGRRRVARSAGLWFVAGGAALLSVTVLIRSGTPTAPKPPAPTARAAPSARAAAEQALTLRVALDRSARMMSLEWLESFARAQKRDLARDPGLVSSRLREHLDRIGIVAPVEAFLDAASGYFADERVPVAERWRTRSVLCDLELLEHFCRVHKLPWCLSRPVIGCAGVWDQTVAVGQVSRSLRCWIQFPMSHGERFFVGRTVTDTWTLPEPFTTDRALIWYALLRVRPGLILDVSVNGVLRRLVAPPPCGDRVDPIHLFAVEWRDAKGRQTNVIGPFGAAVDDPRLRVFTGTWIPTALLGRRIQISTRMVDLPLAPTSVSNPALIGRAIGLQTSSPDSSAPR